MIGFKRRQMRDGKIMNGVKDGKMMNGVNARPI
jgi:hypothetical protein